MARDGPHVSVSWQGYARHGEDACLGW